MKEAYPSTSHVNSGANGPFVHSIPKGPTRLANGEDHLDLLADDVIVDIVISSPGYLKRVDGRLTVIDIYRGYDDFMPIQAADDLRVYHDPDAAVVVLEYEVHGRTFESDRPYDNGSSR